MINSEAAACFKIVDKYVQPSQRCTALATALGASSGSPVSATKVSMFACTPAVLSRKAARRPVMSAFAPSSANRSAEALPMPELPSVPITTLFFKLFLPVLSR
jgi:hypothetical protein